MLDGQYAIGFLGIGPGRMPVDKIAGVDPAQVKRLAIQIIKEVIDMDDAMLLDLDGNPIDLERITPMSIADYLGLTHVPPPGHPANSRWAIRMDCLWASRDGSTPFQLRITKARHAPGGGAICEISANHRLLGDLVARTKIVDDLEYPIAFAFIDFADWHRALILDGSGNPVDFQALARAVMRE